jgi:uncharacterized protein YacL
MPSSHKRRKWEGELVVLHSEPKTLAQFGCLRFQFVFGYNLGFQPVALYAIRIGGSFRRFDCQLVMKKWLQVLLAKRNTAKKAETAAMIVLRLIFVFIVAGIATSMVRDSQTGPNYMPYFVMSGVLLIAAGVIALDMFFEKKRIEIITAVYFGLLVGMVLTYLLWIALTPLLINNPNSGSLILLLAAIVCYTCISMLMQTKDDFRFIIPYVEFVRQVKGSHPLILDTSSLIDGRIGNLATSALLDSELIVPQFVIQELQTIADNNDKLRRVRGRRGLDILNSLQNNDKLEVVIYDREHEEWASLPVDSRLVELAKRMSGRIVTCDFNLCKVARVHDVDVVNLNEITNALRPHFLPGEAFELRIVKQGEGHDQGIGYLDDGTMVVVEGGRYRIGTTSAVVVTSNLQTQSGRMIFAKLDEAA